MKPSRLPTVPPIQMERYRTPLRVRWRNFRRDFAAFLRDDVVPAITKAAALIAGH